MTFKGAYTLTGISPDLWKAVGIRAASEGISKKKLLLRCIECCVSTTKKPKK